MVLPTCVSHKVNNVIMLVIFMQCNSYVIFVFTSGYIPYHSLSIIRFVVETVYAISSEKGQTKIIIKSNETVLRK